MMVAPEEMASPEAMISAASGRPTPQQRTTPSAAAAARGGPVTDYGYVIGELQRIGVITAAILVLLLVLWLILG